MNPEQYENWKKELIRRWEAYKKAVRPHWSRILKAREGRVDGED